MRDFLGIYTPLQLHHHCQSYLINHNICQQAPTSATWNLYYSIYLFICLLAFYWTSTINVRMKKQNRKQQKSMNNNGTTVSLAHLASSPTHFEHRKHYHLVLHRAVFSSLHCTSCATTSFHRIDSKFSNHFQQTLHEFIYLSLQSTQDLPTLHKLHLISFVFSMFTRTVAIFLSLNSFMLLS
jgi:hypothetical protein